MTTLEYSGQEKSLADWGFALGTCRCVHRNLAVSIYTGFIPGASVSDTPTFAFEGRVIIRRNRSGSGTTWSGGYTAFIGYAMNPRADQDGGSAGISYEFHNAWYFLENTAYVQVVKSRNTTAGTTGDKFVTDYVLFSKVVSGVITYLDSGEQITDALQFLLDAFAAQGLTAPYVIGTVSPSLPLPTYEARELMCADVIRKCLELSPDVNCIFAYSGSTTTVHFKPRSAFTSATLAIANGTDHVALDIEKRNDLVPRAVVITYRITNSDDGTPWVVYVQDKYGPNGQSHTSDPDYGLRVIMQTIELAGRSTSTVHADIVATAVDAQSGTLATRIAWWKKKLKWLESDKIKTSTLSIDSATVKDDLGNTVSLSTYPNELVEGQIAPWMNFDSKFVTIVAKCTYEGFTASAQTVKAVKAVEKELSVRIRVTDAVTGTYSTLSSVISGEAVPGLVGYDVDGNPTFSNGLAKQIYDALAVTQYEGQDVRVQAEIMASGGTAPLITLDKKLNLSGGLSEWATMNAQIQAIEEDESRGITAISFGPARYLTAADMAAIFRFNRPRWVWQNPDTRATAQYADAGTDIELGDETPKENSTDGSGTKEFIAATKQITY